MFTRHNLWFGLRGHWWSFENQPSLFSSLGKYLGRFLIMSLWSQKPKDFGVKNWYFAGLETPQCIRLSCQSFSQIHSLHLWQIRISWDWELESVLFRFLFHHSFLSARLGRDLKHLVVGMFSALFIELGQFSRESPKPFSGYYRISPSSLWMKNRSKLQLPSLKLRFYPCKMVGWKMIEFPFVVLAYFQGFHLAVSCSAKSGLYQLQVGVHNSNIRGEATADTHL